MTKISSFCYVEVHSGEILVKIFIPNTKNENLKWILDFWCRNQDFLFLQKWKCSNSYKLTSKWPKYPYGGQARTPMLRVTTWLQEIFYRFSIFPWHLLHTLFHAMRMFVSAQAWPGCYTYAPRYANNSQTLEHFTFFKSNYYFFHFGHGKCLK